MGNEVKEVKLSTKNMFRVVRLVDKIEILDELGDLYSNMGKVSEDDNEMTQESFGTAIGKIVVKAIDKAEQDFYELIADIEKKPLEEIEEQDFMDTIETIEAIIMSKRVRAFLKKYKK